MKVTITITDNPNGTCTAQIHFDPPAQRGQMTAAQFAGHVCLQALEKNAKSMKAKEIITRD